MTLISNKLDAPFFSTLFVTALPKRSVNFGNHIWQDFHKNQYPGPVRNFGFATPQNRGKYWSKLPLKCHICLIGNTYRSYCITCAIIWFMLWLVCLEPVTTCRCGSIIQWRHHCTCVCVTVLWYSKTKITDRARILVFVRVLWDMISKIYRQFWQSFFKKYFKEVTNWIPLNKVEKIIRSICLKPVSMATWRLDKWWRFTVPVYRDMIANIVSCHAKHWWDVLAVHQAPYTCI